MIRVDIHASLRQPVDDVFARLVDIDGYREWRAGGGGIFRTCVQDSPGAVVRWRAYGAAAVRSSASTPRPT